MLSHSEQKILNVCFHLNRKGQLAIEEICNKTRKKPADVKRIVKRLHDLGYLSRNNKGQVQVHISSWWEEGTPGEKPPSLKHSNWFD